MRFLFHASVTYKVSSDSDIMPNLTAHIRTSGGRRPAVSTFHGAQRGERRLFCCVRLVLRPIVPAFLEEVAR